jgi:hypothetical protein
MPCSSPIHYMCPWQWVWSLQTMCHVFEHFPLWAFQLEGSLKQVLQDVAPNHNNTKGKFKRSMCSHGNTKALKANRSQLGHWNLLTFHNDHFNANQHKITLFTMGQSELVYSILHPLQNNVPKTKLAQTRTILNFSSPSHFTKTT